jgi:hypothetical protein
MGDYASGRPSLFLTPEDNRKHRLPHYQRVVYRRLLYLVTLEVSSAERVDTYASPGFGVGLAGK